MAVGMTVTEIVRCARLFPLILKLCKKLPIQMRSTGYRHHFQVVSTSRKGKWRRQSSHSSGAPITALSWSRPSSKASHRASLLDPVTTGHVESDCHARLDQCANASGVQTRLDWRRVLR